MTGGTNARMPERRLPWTHCSVDCPNVGNTNAADVVPNMSTNATLHLEEQMPEYHNADARYESLLTRPNVDDDPTSRCCCEHVNKRHAVRISRPAIISSMSLPAKNQENAYQTWLKVSRRKPLPRYTTIDGDASASDMNEPRFIRAAYDLRERTRLEIILKVVEFGGLSFSEKAKCIQLVRDAPILPGLIAYVYTHLVVCQHTRWFGDWSGHLSRLEKAFEDWKKYDEIEWIVFYKGVRGALLSILRDTRPKYGKHRCNTALLDKKMISKQDILNLAAYLALCVTGPRKGHVLNADSTRANDVVQLCNDLLSADVELGEWNRRCILNVLLSLLNAESNCPWSLLLGLAAIRGIVQQNEGNQGTSCTMHKGMYGSRVVALKELKSSVPGTRNLFYEQLFRETILWRHLHHPNCLPFYGLYMIPSDDMYMRIAFVSPWMQQGNLGEYLNNNPNANRESLILDVVNGLDYLHSMRPHIAHRDIKPANILITRTGRACLADFGLAVAFDMGPEFHTTTTICGTISYMAPEMFTAITPELRAELNKRACDMYALGCTIYAVYAGQHPFHDLPEIELIRNVVLGQRPGFPEGRIPPDMWDFVLNLWSRDPMERHTAAKALSWMKYKLGFAITDESDPDKIAVAPLEEEWKCKVPQGRSLLSLDLVSLV